MRWPPFANRTLLALLTAFVVGSDVGNSAEQTKVRVTTWNLEWFPNGSAHDATPEVQTQRIAAAADVLRSITVNKPLAESEIFWSRTRPSLQQRINFSKKFPVDGLPNPLRKFRNWVVKPEPSSGSTMRKALASSLVTGAMMCSSVS